MYNIIIYICYELNLILSMSLVIAFKISPGDDALWKKVFLYAFSYSFTIFKLCKKRVIPYTDTKFIISLDVRRTKQLLSIFLGKSHLFK